MIKWFLLIQIHFQKNFITPDLKGLDRLFLELESLEDLNFQDVQSKVLYKCCVKVLNKTTLKETTLFLFVSCFWQSVCYMNKCKCKEQKDTLWREKVGLEDNVKPVWRILYKPPLEKCTGDLQWKIS